MKEGGPGRTFFLLFMTFVEEGGDLHARDKPHMQLAVGKLPMRVVGVSHACWEGNSRASSGLPKKERGAEEKEGGDVWKQEGIQRGKELKEGERRGMNTMGPWIYFIDI